LATSPIPKELPVMLKKFHLSSKYLYLKNKNKPDMLKKLLCSIFFLISIYGYSQSVNPTNDSSSIKTPFTAVEIMPEFEGGENAMYEFISKNLEYPSEAIRNRIEGRVFVKFTIEADGTIKDVQVLGKKRLGYGLEEAAIAVIEKMPKWKPGAQSGTPVPVYFNLPIRFRLLN